LRNINKIVFVTSVDSLQISKIDVSSILLDVLMYFTKL